MGGRSAVERLTFLALIVSIGGPLPGYAWGGKTRLARRYRPGQQMVYQTTIKTIASVHCSPEGLKAFLPPIPTELGTRQQNTVTVRAVSADGITQVENRFDRFEFESNLSEVLPQEFEESAAAAQEEFSQHLTGQTLTVRYDRAGRLIDFGGAENLLQELDDPLRETARQILRVFLEQMGGGGLYPDHAVKKGEEWKHKLDAQPTDTYPLSVEGESTLRYVGKTRYRGAKAGIVDLHFTSLLRPAIGSLRQNAAWAQLEKQGMHLDIRINAEGKGRVLVALDDGRVLQNQTTIRQTLNAELANPPAMQMAVNGPLTLRVDSETLLQVEGEGQRDR